MRPDVVRNLSGPEISDQKLLGVGSFGSFRDESRGAAYQLNADRPAEEPQGPGISGMIALGRMFLQRQWWLLLLGSLLGIILAPLAFFVASPAYEATATIMLDTSRIQVFSQTVGDTPFDNSAAVESQLEIMRSDSVARKVLTRLNLDQDPEYAVVAEGKLSKWFGPEFAEALGRTPLLTPERQELARIGLLHANVDIERVPGTFAISITARSESPKRAAEIANAVAAAYLEEHVEKKQEVSTRTADWLGERIAELKNQLSEGQQAVSEFRKANGLSGTDISKVNDNRTSELYSQLNAARTAAREAQVRLDRVKTVIAGYDAAEVKPVIPDLASDALVTRLREQYLELINREADWIKRFGVTHEATVRLQQRIKDIEAALLEEYRRLADSYASEHEIANARAESIEKALTGAKSEKEGLDTAQFKLTELERVVQKRQELLDSFLLRQTETQEQRSFPIARAWVLNDATEPVRKSLKKTLKVSAILFMLGAALGAGGAVLRDLTDGTFRRLADIRKTFPRALGELVPVAEGRRRRPRAKAAGSDKALVNVDKLPAERGPRPIEPSDDIAWSVISDPDSQFAEAIRAVKHRVAQSTRKTGRSVVAVTGAHTGDGATTIAASVALSAADGSTKTLLIDCNLRDPGLTRLLAPDAQAGLVEVLDGTVAIKDAVYVDHQTGLEFLPAVVSHGVIVENFLASGVLSKLIASVRSSYHVVIVDLPPISPTIDVGLTTDFISNYVVVVQWGETDIGALRHGLERISLDAENVATVVMNKVDTQRLSRFDYEASRWFKRA